MTIESVPFYRAAIYDALGPLNDGDYDAERVAERDEVWNYVCWYSTSQYVQLARD